MLLLSELFDASVIRLGMRAQNKKQAIEELMDLVIESGAVEPDLRDHMLEVVFQREQSMSTGMEHGIALPHGSSDRVDKVVAAIGIAPHGIPFDSMDGNPAQIIILLVFPRDQFGVHVRHLAVIAQLLSNASFREALIHAHDSEEVMNMLRSEGPTQGVPTNPSKGSEA